MTIDIEESDRQLMILSLALCSLLRPGWEPACRDAAKKLDGGSSEMFENFRKFNGDQTPHHQEADSQMKV